jgi:hypothetical protein
VKLLFSSLLVFVSVFALRAETENFDWNASLAALEKGDSRVVILPSGTHRLPASGGVLKGLRNVVIEGSGATLLVGDRGRSALQIDNCESLTLRNLRIDYDPLPFTQGDVVSVDRGKRRIEVRLHVGYPDLAAAAETPGAFSDGRLQLFDRETATLKVGAPDYAVARLENAGEGVVGVVFPEWQMGLEKIAPGDRVTLSSRAAEGISIRNSRDVTLEDVTIFSAPNVAIVVRSCETAGTFRRVRIVPGPPPPGATQPRLMSACADGLNVAHTRVGPVVEQCEFAYQADDAINLHGAMVPVLKWIDERSFLTVLPWRNNRLEVIARKDDVIRFLAPPSYQVAGEGVIREVTKTTEPVDPWLPEIGKIWTVLKVNPESVTFYKITLEKRPPGVEPGQFCEIPATAAAGFVIRDNYFHDHRARGLRLMTGDGLILNNRFERLKGCAISLGAEFSFWREAGWCRNVVISGNHIRSVGQGLNIQLPDSYTLGAISVMARTDDGTATPFQGNENLVIENNRIDGCSVNGISISNARQVRVNRNTIRNVNQAASSTAGRDRNLSSTEPISIIRAEATLSDNLFP